MLDLQQEQQQQQQYPGVLHERKSGSKVHFCVCCQTPIAAYGRLMPCMHAFCLTCATDMPKCFICHADIHRLERTSQPLFISSATLQSFHTEDALRKHTRQLYQHLLHQPAFAGVAAAAAGQQQQQLLQHHQQQHHQQQHHQQQQQRPTLAQAAAAYNAGG